MVDIKKKQIMYSDLEFGDVFQFNTNEYIYTNAPAAAFNTDWQYPFACSVNLRNGMLWCPPEDIPIEPIKVTMVVN